MGAWQLIRPAVEADIPRIVDWAVQLRAAVNGPQAVCRITTGHTVAGLIHSPDGAVWVSGHGFIAAKLGRTIISPDVIAEECGWFAEDRTGLRLLRAFERWADKHGATLKRVSCNGGAAQRILERAGYRQAEISMVK